MNKLIEKAKNTHCLSKEEITALLADNSINKELFEAADEVRKKYIGDEVHLRGLIEFSNICKRNCLYCGIRAENSNCDRYRMHKDRIVELAKNALRYGYRTIVLQSGEDDYYSAEVLSDILREIKKNDTAITLGIGERSYEDYKALKEAGADRFLLRIETTDENLYKQMHPNMSLQERKDCLYNLKKVGFETGTGVIVGLPGQTLESLAKDILFFKELDADMIGIGPFISHGDTPLADCAKVNLTQRADENSDNFELALKMMAMTRLLLPDINLPATTAMETLRPNGRFIALQSGANVIMPNVGDTDNRKKYEIYPGKVGTNDSPDKYRENIIKKIEAIGRTVSREYGFRKKK